MFVSVEPTNILDQTKSEIHNFYFQHFLLEDPNTLVISKWIKGLFEYLALVSSIVYGVGYSWSRFIVNQRVYWPYEDVEHGWRNQKANTNKSREASQSPFVQGWTILTPPITYEGVSFVNLNYSCLSFNSFIPHLFIHTSLYVPLS